MTKITTITVLYAVCCVHYDQYDDDGNSADGNDVDHEDDHDDDEDDDDDDDDPETVDGDGDGRGPKAIWSPMCLPGLSYWVL
jgi:hypothetical protein